MGVNLRDIIPHRETSFEELRGKTIAVDALNTIYQFLSSIRQQDGTPLMDSAGNVTSHLTGLLYRTNNLLKMGIKPIYVFDGQAPELKRKTLRARSSRMVILRLLPEGRSRPVPIFNRHSIDRSSGFSVVVAEDSSKPFQPSDRP